MPNTEKMSSINLLTWLTNVDYFKKVIQPTIEELKKHKDYLKNNLKKNFF